MNRIAFGIASVAVALSASAGIASAAPIEYTTVDGTDYPVCAVEDCSDQPNQIGVWRNDGRSWLIIGEETYPIVP